MRKWWLSTGQRRDGEYYGLRASSGYQNGTDTCRSEKGQNCDGLSED